MLNGAGTSHEARVEDAVGTEAPRAGGEVGGRRATLDPMSTVLVVDDEPPILHTMEINPRARRFDVLPAATGTQAPAWSPDAIPTP